jgi:lipopolysaccharide export system permease protein
VANPSDYGRFVVELHQRLSSPLNALGYGVLAFVFLVYGEYSRRGQALRIINAAAFFVILQVIGLGLVNLAAKNLSLVPLLYVVSGLTVFVPLFIVLYQPKLPLPALPRRTGAVEST